MPRRFIHLNPTFFTCLRQGIYHLPDVSCINPGARMQKQTQFSDATTSHQYCSLPTLPFDVRALEPYISENTIEFHYGKHHKGYVDKLNKIIVGTEFESMSLEDVIRKSKGSIFNNAAQVWNHTFFWNCLTPSSRELSKGNLSSAIESSFGTFDNFKMQFTQKGINLFGSGYVWLVADRDQKLSIKTGKNAYNPLVDELTPLLTCDVWEHAYYLDYQNKRNEFLKNFWKIVNWEFVESRFESFHSH